MAELTTIIETAIFNNTNEVHHSVGALSKLTWIKQDITAGNGDVSAVYDKKFGGLA